MRKREFSTAIPFSYAQPLLDELQRLGCDLPALWHGARLETPLPAVLQGEVSTLPAAEFSRFYRHSIGLLEKRCCERDGHRPLGKPAVDMLCYCVIHCASLREVIARATRFLEAMEERGGELQLIETGAVAQLTMDARRRQQDEAAMLVDLTGLYFYHQLFSWLTGRPLRLLSVGLSYPEPRRAHPLLSSFDAPLRYDQPVNSLSFDARLLGQKVLRSYAELEDIIDYFPFDLGLNGIPESKLADQVRLLLLDALQHRGRALSGTAIAQLFHVSTATLRRRLREEGLSYAELRASCQREAAEYLLSHTGRRLEDIAERLGMGSDRAFRRAFRHWTGLSPSDYRLRAQAALS